MGLGKSKGWEDDLTNWFPFLDEQRPRQQLRHRSKDGKPIWAHVAAPRGEVSRNEEDQPSSS